MEVVVIRIMANINSLFQRRKEHTQEKEGGCEILGTGTYRWQGPVLCTMFPTHDIQSRAHEARAREMNGCVVIN